MQARTRLMKTDKTSVCYRQHARGGEEEARTRVGRTGWKATGENGTELGEGGSRDGMEWKKDERRR